MYLLDTNACIRILNNTSAPLITRLRQHDPSEICLCAIMKAELLFGAHRSARATENLDLPRRFFVPFVSLPFDDRCAEEHATIRTHLARAGTPIGPNDLIVAATARAHKLVLVSHNVAEFARVSGLSVEDWEVPT
ncbi:MAG: type II toxin-antitoxin system VapC family toxin [Candidatus Binatia bacterium]